MPLKNYLTGLVPAPLRKKASAVANASLAILRLRWIFQYGNQQQHIRANFDSGYGIGYPTAPVRATYDGFLGLKVRLYQNYTGGRWGRSTLIAKNSRLGILDPRSWYTDQPKLITGTIYEKWLQLGNLKGLGGPRGPQYRSGPYINQDFEGGQIGFVDGNLAQIWWHRWNEPWHL